MRKRSAISGQSLTRGAAAPQEIARRSPRVKGQQSATPKLSALSYQLLARGRSRRSLVLNPVFDPEAEPQAQTRREPRTLNPSFAPAFTLTELLVSLVILVGMMTLIATIFATAGKSSGVAQVQTRLHRQLLQVADVMGVDLDNTLPGMDASGVVPQGVLAIAGAAVEAKDTAKSPVSVRRADVLMLLTKQRFEPFIYDPSAHNAVLDDYKQVVYGHADIGKVNPANGEWFSTINYVESRTLPAGASGYPVSDMLASEWHLARRVVGFVKTAADDNGTEDWPPTKAPILGTDPGGAMTDVIYDYSPPSSFLSTIHPGFYAYDQRGGVANLTEFYLKSGYKYRWIAPGSYYLLDAEPAGSPAYWWQRTTGNQWARQEGGGPNLTITRPVPVAAVLLSYQTQTNVLERRYRFWPGWFYDPAGATGGNSYRTRIDPMPPPGMPQRTAAYFLPSCSEFKVEFTYDDPREIAVDPATGQPFLVDLNGDGNPDAPAASPVNWQTVPRGHMYVWTGLSTDPNVYDSSDPASHRNMTFPFRWPRALRITIRAYAPGGALDYPITHSLIHVWQ